MSVKNDYEMCQAELERVRKARNEANSTLASLQKKQYFLWRKKKELKSLSSPLSKKLHEEASTELLEAEKRVKNAEQTLSKLEATYEELLQLLEEFENSPAKYIEEQSSLMTQQLVNCVNEHELRLSRWQKANFFILLEEHEDRYGDTPTGNIKICCPAVTPDLFATSTDFYFEECLYEASWGPFDNRYVLYTDWFKNYQNSFFSALKVKITTAFEEHPNFKAQFTDDSHFTLELR